VDRQRARLRARMRADAAAADRNNRTLGRRLTPAELDQLRHILRALKDQGVTSAYQAWPLVMEHMNVGKDSVTRLWKEL
jgi:hypothetical protein